MADPQPSSTAEAPPSSNAKEAPIEDDAEINDAVNPPASGAEAASSTAQDATSQSQAPATQDTSSGGLDGTTDASDATQVPPSTDPTTANTASQAPATETVEARIPQKKDATLREFLSRMDSHAPIIPDAVTNHYLTLAGLPPPPQTSPHLARLLALATQKFVADVAADAYQYARIRSSHTTSNTANAMMATGQAPLPNLAGGIGGAAGGAPGAAGAAGKAGDKGPALGVQRPGFGGGGQGGQQGRTVLTMEDLGMAVGEYGVNVKRGEFYR